MQEVHVWSDRLDLDHGDLDAEHHLQIAMIGALAEAIEQGRPVMARHLAEQLEKYSAAHFVGEELVMEANGYPRAALHHGEHEAILNWIAELRAELRGEEREPGHALALDLLTSIGAHIASSDRAFAQYTSERRQAGRRR
jgi:hemerythrin-like metal-binding protein